MIKAINKLFNNKKAVFLSAFFVPFFILLFVFIIIKITPFGNNNLLIIDMHYQYVDYFSYFKSLFSENNLFYTFSKTLGGDMIGFSAYYLLSPFNFLFLLFPNSAIPTVVSFMAILKISSCGLSFCYFLNKTFKISNISLVIFSTVYALMAYNVVYIHNIMWLDGVIMLPLVVLGIQNIANKKSPVLYIISLALSLIFNYYIGFMICIASIIFFAYHLILKTDKLKEYKQCTKKSIVFIVSSLCSAGLSAFLLIPVYASLQGGKATFTLENLALKTNFKFIDVFTKLFTSPVENVQLVTGLPNIFCGILVLTLVILYFFNKKIPIKEKILSSAVIAVFLFSFNIYGINLIWHGFNAPAGFPYRFSFLFSFFLIYLAFKSFLNIKELERKQYFYTAFIVIASAIIIFRQTYSYIKEIYIYVDIALIISFLILLYFIFKTKNKFFKRTMIVLLILLNFGNLFVNTYHSIKRQLPEKPSAFTNFVEDINPIVKKIKESDDGFYRMEQTFSRAMNDPMQFSYNGLSHYSSSEKTFVKDFMGGLGFMENSSWVSYNEGSTVTADSLLGVKYLISDRGTFKPYEPLFKQNQYETYKNPYAMSILSTVHKDTLNLNFDTDNVFERQNAIFSSVSEKDLPDIFSQLSCDSIVLNNLLKSEKNGSFIYKKIDPNLDADISYYLKVNKPGIPYFYASAPSVQEASLYINDKLFGDYFNAKSWNAVALDEFCQDKTIKVTIKPKRETISFNDAYFYSENTDTLKLYLNQIKPYDIEKISSSHLKSTATVDKDNVLLLSIPYEKSWKFTANGKPVEAKMVFDALTAIPLPEGTYTIEAKYTPDGLYSGIIVTCSTLVLIALFVIFKKLNKKQTNK